MQFDSCFIIVYLIFIIPCAVKFALNLIDYYFYLLDLIFDSVWEEYCIVCFFKFILVVAVPRF